MAIANSKDLDYFGPGHDLGHLFSSIDECQGCGGTSLKTIDSRKVKSGYRYRRRECDECGDRVSTIELRVHDLDRVLNSYAKLLDFARMLKELEC